MIQFQSATYYLRLAEADDEEFFWQLYVLQQSGFIQSLGWDATQQKIFLQMQYRARNGSYAMAYPHANDAVLCGLDGTAMGRLLTEETASDLHIIDFALLPQYRSKGIGSQVLRDLQARCRKEARKIKLHVPCDNPASRLYTRMGFRLIEQNGVYAQMEWAG